MLAGDIGHEGMDLVDGVADADGVCVRYQQCAQLRRGYLQDWHDPTARPDGPCKGDWRCAVPFPFEEHHLT